jgi:hypothetical protein
MMILMGDRDACNPRADIGRLIVADHLSGWPRSLTWDDLPVVRRVSNEVRRDALAWVKCGLRYSFHGGATSLGRWVPVGLRVEVFLDRANSGVLYHPRGRRLLRHEQGHLDIAGLCGRELCAALLALEAGSPQELFARAEELLWRTIARMNGLNQLYDSVLGGTTHGANPLGQWLWNRRLDRAIQLWQPLPKVRGFLPRPRRPVPRWWRVLNTPLSDWFRRRPRDKA